MTEFIDAAYIPWILSILLLLLLWTLYRYRRSRGVRIERVLSGISFDRMHKVVLPNGDEGEILIDQLLLTSQGLLVLEVKDVDGAVFGGDNMHDWTVISVDRRFTFPNPQNGLYDRIAAVSEMVSQVPVLGRVLFLDGAEFNKGVPELVTTLEQLERDFSKPDNDAAQANIEAFRPHWDVLKSKRA